MERERDRYKKKDRARDRDSEGERVRLKNTPPLRQVNRVMRERQTGVDQTGVDSPLSSTANIEGTDWERYPYRRGDNQIPGMTLNPEPCTNA